MNLEEKKRTRAHQSTTNTTELWFSGSILLKDDEHASEEPRRW